MFIGQNFGESGLGLRLKFNLDSGWSLLFDDSNWVLNSE